MILETGERVEPSPKPNHEIDSTEIAHLRGDFNKGILYAYEHPDEFWHNGLKEEDIPEGIRITWEDAVRRMNAPHHLNPSKTGFELASKLRGRGTFFGVNEEGQMLFKDSGQTLLNFTDESGAPCDIDEIRKRVLGTQESPTGYELFGAMKQSRQNVIYEYNRPGTGKYVTPLPFEAALAAQFERKKFVFPSFLEEVPLRHCLLEPNQELSTTGKTPLISYNTGSMKASFDEKFIPADPIKRTNFLARLGVIRILRVN